MVALSFTFKIVSSLNKSYLECTCEIKFFLEDNIAWELGQVVQWTAVQICIEELLGTKPGPFSGVMYVSVFLLCLG